MQMHHPYGLYDPSQTAAAAAAVAAAANAAATVRHGSGDANDANKRRRT